MRREFRQATISALLSLLSLVYFSHKTTIPFAYAIFRFGFPFSWYTYRVIDLDGTLRTFSYLNALTDIVLWSAILFCFLHLYNGVRAYRKRPKDISTKNYSTTVREGSNFALLQCQLSWMSDTLLRDQRSIACEMQSGRSIRISQTDSSTSQRSVDGVMGSILKWKRRIITKPVQHRRKEEETNHRSRYESNYDFGSPTHYHICPPMSTVRNKTTVQKRIFHSIFDC